MISPREKFQALLWKLFQFDCAELDFGICRIMNQKRAAIENFIEKDLLDAVTKEVSSGALAHESDLADQLKQLTARIREDFGG
jgi:adenine-specific DNA-methyltransferase